MTLFDGFEACRYRHTICTILFNPMMKFIFAPFFFFSRLAR